jgi:hypothetical protein
MSCQAIDEVAKAIVQIIIDGSVCFAAVILFMMSLLMVIVLIIMYGRWPNVILRALPALTPAPQPPRPPTFRLSMDLLCRKMM